MILALTFLTAALWLAAGLRLLLEAMASRARPDFLVGLGALGAGVILALHPHGGVATIPAEIVLLSLALLWASTGDEATAMERGDTLLPLGAFAVATAACHLLEAALGAPLIVRLGVPVRPLEVIGCGLAVWTWLRVRTGRNLRFVHVHWLQAREIAWSLAAAGLAGLLGGALADPARLAFLGLAAAPLLRRAARTDALLTARAAAAALALALGAQLVQRPAEALREAEALARTQQALTRLAATHAPLQEPLDVAVESWIHAEPQRLHRDRMQAARQAHTQLVNPDAQRRLGERIETLQRSLARHTELAEDAFLGVAARVASFGDPDGLKSTEERALAARQEARLVWARLRAEIEDARAVLTAHESHTVETLAAARGLAGATLAATALLGLALLWTALRVGRRPESPGPRDANGLLPRFAEELRRPLATLLGHADLAIAEAEPETRLRHLRTLQAQGHALHNLIQDTADLVRLRQEGVAVERSRVVVHDLLRDVVAELQPLAGAKGLLLCSEVREHVPRELDSDRQVLARILQALVRQAIAWTRRGSVTVVAEGTPGRLRIQVRDTSAGLDANRLATLFEPFGPTAEAGAGIGLAVARQLAAAIDARITVRTAPGKGCETVLEMPLPLGSVADVLEGMAQTRYLAEAAPSCAAAAGTRPPDPAPFQGRVLVAENDPRTRAALVDLLSQSGVDVEVAPDGTDTLARLGEQRFDLVLMDLELQGTGGLAATTRLRERNDFTPVVALAEGEVDRDRCLAAGCNGVLAKPVDRESLNAALGLYLPAARR